MSIALGSALSFAKVAVYSTEIRVSCAGLKIQPVAEVASRTEAFEKSIVIVEPTGKVVVTCVYHTETVEPRRSPP